MNKQKTSLLNFKLSVKRQELSVSVKARDAFTLIELVIYIALMMVTLIGALFIANNLITSNSRLSELTKTEEEINFIFKKFEWTFVDVSNINSPQAGSSDSSISINKANFDDNPIFFSFDTGDITMKVGQNDENILNSDLLDIDNIFFEHIPQSGDRPAGIKISININEREYEKLIFLR